MITTVDLVEAAPAPRSPDEIVEGLMRTVSASRLSTYLGCRLKFFFRYVAELQKPKSAALHVGSTLHSALKIWNKARWRGAPLTHEQLREEFAKAWDESEEPVQWKGEEADERAAAWRLLETYLQQAQTVVRPDAVEVPIEADMSEYGLPKIVGILDLVEAGKVVDYKTSATTPNPERVAHQLEVQTTMYGLLYRANTGHREKGIELHHLVKLKTPKVVITPLPPVSSAQESRLCSLVEAYVAGLERRDFSPAPGLQCVACEFFNECRQWH